jgi:hypothetical protein
MSGALAIGFHLQVFGNLAGDALDALAAIGFRFWRTLGHRVALPLRAAWRD